MSEQELNTLSEEIFKHIDDVNKLLEETDEEINESTLKELIINKTYNLNSKDSNTFLASLLYYLNNLESEKISISRSDANKIIIINFVNVLLEEMQKDEILYEVVL